MTFLNVTSTAFITTKHYRTLIKCVGWDNAVGRTLRAGRIGVRSKVEARFHGPFQTSPGARPVTCIVRNRVPFTGVKRPGRKADHPLPYRAEVKETVQPQISPSVPSWYVI